MPVVDITDAAASTAMFLGRRYGVVTSLDRTVPLIEDRLLLAGLAAHCASVRASGLGVLELEEDPARAVEAIAGQAAAAVTEDGAEVVVLGCAGMAGLAEAVRTRTGVPVVDGVPAAVTVAESLVRLGLSTSKGTDVRPSGSGAHHGLAAPLSRPPGARGRPLDVVRLTVRDPVTRG